MYRSINSFLRHHTCCYNFGMKKEAGTRPIRCMEVLNRFFLSKRENRYRVARIPKNWYDDHRAGIKTLFGYGNSNPKQSHTLFMFDIDTHHRGNLQTALVAGKWLQSRFPGLVIETSTNGGGIHGYGLLYKSTYDSKQIREGLLNLQRWLKCEVDELGFEIDKIEIKGLPNEFEWRNDVMTCVKFGTLFKLPRTLSLEELQSTHEFQMIDLLHGEFAERRKKMAPVASSGIAEVTGSWAGRLLLPEALETWRGIAERFLGGEVVKVDRRLVNVEDFAVVLAICETINDLPNADGSLPIARIVGFWQSMVDYGDTDRLPSPVKVSKVLRFCGERGFLEVSDDLFYRGRAKRRRVRIDELKVQYGVEDVSPKVQYHPPADRDSHPILRVDENPDVSTTHEICQERIIFAEGETDKCEFANLDSQSKIPSEELNLTNE